MQLQRQRTVLDWQQALKDALAKTSMSWEDCIDFCRDVAKDDVIEFVRIQLDLGIWVENEGVVSIKI